MRIAKLMLAVMSSLMLVSAVAATPVEGKDYTRLAALQPTADPRKVVVTEFFSYQCPHCYSFSKPFAAWARKVPADVLVERVPVAFGRASWETASRSYLVLNSMNVVSKVDDALFEAIHVKHQRLDIEQEMFAWIANTGIDAKEFRTQYRSFGIDTLFKSAEARTRAHQIPGVPAIVIDGRYLVAIQDNGTFANQLAVVSELIVQARKDKARRP